ncbi:hypothetical protein [Streptomyces formicae]|uniref:Integral membrane protein n=1 Tax=Streptomyces formicae TaxID=1616117 RepID=A0ABY3WLU2_9ACTN|nr:hypothetical protein [Streptomyces formicae]UNM13105.1 hypothetical protein J4032_17810 [Streptomyces formicae]UNM13241.1 hypothetical protein J4032_18660 [Streptomyces formicae]
MAVSWAKGIIIAEPAPRAAYLARYLAPHWKGLVSSDSEDGVGVAVTATCFTLAGSLAFGVGGAGVAVLAVEASGRSWLPQFWLGFDAVLLLCLVASYRLVGRYGLRFYDTAAGVNPLWRLAAVGNCAWRCLPRAQREAQVPRLRALNAAARVLLTDPEDDRTRKALATHAEVLRKVSTSVLQDSPSSLPHGAVVVDPMSPGECSSACLPPVPTGGSTSLSLVVPAQSKPGPTEDGSR